MKKKKLTPVEAAWGRANTANVDVVFCADELLSLEKKLEVARANLSRAVQDANAARDAAWKLMSEIYNDGSERGR